MARNFGSGSSSVAKGVRSDKFQNYLDQFDANIKKKELKEYEALVLKIKDWNIDYTSTVEGYRITCASSRIL